MKSAFIHLASRHTSLVIKNDGRMPEVMYWGKRLPDETDLAPLGMTLSRPIPGGRIDSDTALSLCPELATGLFTSPGLEGSRNGSCWAPSFMVVDAEITPQSVTFTCRDKIAELSLVIDITLDEESDVCQSRLRLHNDGQTEYQLQRLSQTLPVKAQARELMYFHGRWTHEFQTKRMNLEQGAFTQENRRGRTSHERFPAIVAGQTGFSETHGELYGFHLGWSGSHRIHAEVMSDGRRFVQAGELLMPGEMTIMPGESYETPVLYSCYSPDGLNGMSQRFHRYVRQNIVHFDHQAKPRPVHLNTWEGIYFDHDPDYILQMAETAADLGVERFIIDDGWFRGRNHDRAGLGDWFLDQSKYPQGLQAIVECVKQQGMEFGLWFEPEMVNPDSDLYRSHPDWVLKTEGYEQVTVRNQYVLNLQKPEVFDYLYGCMNSLLSEYDIRYIKWDMNRELVQGTHDQHAANHGHVKAFYRLIDQLRKAHPQLEIETCSGGGGRIDYQVLSRTHRFWASDCNDPIERQSIQKGASYFFPLEVTGAHIGAGHCHTTGRTHSDGFRGMTALFGHMGVELDPVKATEQEKATMKKYISLHKSLRTLLHTGEHFRCDTDHQDTQAWGVISCDKKQAVVMFTQIALAEYALAAPLIIPGLDDGLNYRVTLLENSSGDLYMKQLPLWMEEPTIVNGALLAQAGLMMPAIQPESAILIKLEAV
ncbi:alpha-galactosidase [Photobacterium rosenbergii]|uniref:Alpha-galactosidase n=1 Tax=Photobacterium rosenbergii TaxID=294936 RepID=A0A2T3N9Q3_9GAMM|nr:alpha-galactosidase [Photobacterium rosenbergii]PSW10248.1 alpha-galactosidase [Photobacterium rosenbergii]